MAFGLKQLHDMKMRLPGIMMRLYTVENLYKWVNTGKAQSAFSEFGALFPSP